MSNSNTSATYWRVGALYGAAAVCLGAFGAHGLKSRAGITDAKLASWQTAAHYQVCLLLFLFMHFQNCMFFCSPWARRLTTARAARTLDRPARRARQPRRGRAVHGRHDHVQREHLRSDPEPAAEDSGAGDAVGRAVSDWGLAVVGV